MRILHFLLISSFYNYNYSVSTYELSIRVKKFNKFEIINDLLYCSMIDNSELWNHLINKASQSLWDPPNVLGSKHGSSSVHLWKKYEFSYNLSQHREDIISQTK